MIHFTDYGVIAVIMDQFGRSFRHLLQDVNALQSTKRFVVLSVVGATRIANL